MGDSELIKAIVHYQQCLEKYTKRNDESRMLYCIGKLYKMPITVEHLEQTGVGRTVNSLRKFNGEVGDAAKSLVSKWKEMVMVVGEDNNDAKETSVKSESKSHRDESKEKKHKEKSSSSSHKESDKKHKYDTSEKNSSSYSNDDESSSKKEEHGSKHKSHKKDREPKYHRHKSSKRKHSSDNSDSEDEDHERTAHSKDYKYHRSSKYNADESEDESPAEIEKSRSNKQKSAKRKHEDSDEDEEYNPVITKHKKYSEPEDSDEESEIEEKREKSSHKHYSKYKEEPHTSKDKNKHHHKHKDKKEKKEHSNEDKSKRHTDDHRSKERHSSKEKVRSSSEKRDKEESSKKSKHSSKHHHDTEHKSSKKSSTHSKNGTSMHENGIGSGSGTSFAEALGMLEPTSSKANKKKTASTPPVTSEKVVNNNVALLSESSKPTTSDLLQQKKLEPLDVNISTLLPEITPNYRPLGHLPLENSHSKNNKVTTEEEALSAIMYNKISRTKVYSGNKVIWGKVPTLFELCTRVLQDNIDALEYTGGVPYSILKPVIERANPDQLYMLEHHNPYLIEETDELWQLHCQKEFRTKRREEMETWRDMYMRCLDEREAKLKALTANIKQSQDKSLPVRQTKLAYVDGHSIVKPPRSVARKQLKRRLRNRKKLGDKYGFRKCLAYL